MKTGLTTKLLSATAFGAVILLIAFFVIAEPAKRYELLMEATKDLGVIVIGLAVVEVVWAAVGGAPTEVALEELQQRNQETVDTIRRSSLLVEAASKIGLMTVGLRESDLSFAPEYFAQRIAEAKGGVDLCGYTLNYVAGNDVIVHAMVEKARTPVPVRVVLPSVKNSHLAAINKPDFIDPIKVQSESLARRLHNLEPAIQVRLLDNFALTLCLLRVDSEMLVVPYLHQFQTAESPRMRVRGQDSPLFKTYLAEFESFFNSAAPMK